MPSANKMTTPVAVDLPEIEGRYAELDGYTVASRPTRRTSTRPRCSPGLPDDRCQCPHWGVVQRPDHFRWADHEETYGAGDAYYAAPGHLPLITRRHQLVEFSPSDELEQTMAVVEANLATAGARA